MSVTINNDNEVRINNTQARVQLPLESANKRATVKMVGDTIVVQSKTGITLTFNGEKKVIIFSQFSFIFFCFAVIVLESSHPSHVKSAKKFKWFRNKFPPKWIPNTFFWEN